MPVSPFESFCTVPSSINRRVKKKKGKRIGNTFCINISTPASVALEYLIGLMRSTIIATKTRIDKTSNRVMYFTFLFIQITYSFVIILITYNVFSGIIEEGVLGFSISFFYDIIRKLNLNILKNNTKQEFLK